MTIFDKIAHLNTGKYEYERTWNQMIYQLSMVQKNTEHDECDMEIDVCDKLN